LQASIVIGDGAGELNSYATLELENYLRILSGAEVPIIAEAGFSSRPAKEGLILVGGPAFNSSIPSARAAIAFSGRGS
jgi:hypothetical protein